MGSTALKTAMALAAMALMLVLSACGGGDENNGSSDNTAPVADAGADQAAGACSTVRLDGSSSSDADGDTLSYDWSVSSSPRGSLADFSDGSAASPSFVPDVAGDYVLRLTVSDGSVDSAADTLTITVTSDTAVSFFSDVLTIFSSFCISCHAAGGLASFLPLTSTVAYGNLVGQRSQVTDSAPNISSEFLVRGCDSANSALYQRVSGAGLGAAEDTMPLNGPDLTLDFITGIRTWIDDGAQNN